MAPRRPPAAPRPPQDGELEARIRQGEVERLRRQASDSRLREKLTQAAQARGDDPYQLLAQAIRQMLRSG